MLSLLVLTEPLFDHASQAPGVGARAYSHPALRHRARATARTRPLPPSHAALAAERCSADALAASAAGAGAAAAGAAGRATIMYVVPKCQRQDHSTSSPAWGCLRGTGFGVRVSLVLAAAMRCYGIER